MEEATKRSKVKKGPKCLRCEKQQKTKLQHGPDGCFTLCDSCFDAFAHMRIELYLTEGGQVSVRRDQGSHVVTQYELRRTVFPNGRMETWKAVYNNPTVLRFERIETQQAPES